MKLLHRLFRRFCNKHLIWRSNTLVCSICGRVAGFRYQFDDAIRVFIFPEMAQCRIDILRRHDTYCIGKDEDVLGKISFVDFDQAIAEMRASIAKDTENYLEDLRSTYVIYISENDPWLTIPDDTETISFEQEESN